eukprot:SAG31_NODE_36514_length_312_cov_1.446009_1_plen_84_part_01
MSARDYISINGYSNRFWGCEVVLYIDLCRLIETNFFRWGKEDDDLYHRIVTAGLSLSREIPARGRFTCLDHPRDYSNVDVRFSL